MSPIKNTCFLTYSLTLLFTCYFLSDQFGFNRSIGAKREWSVTTGSGSSPIETGRCTGGSFTSLSSRWSSSARAAQAFCPLFQPSCHRTESLRLQTRADRILTTDVHHCTWCRDHTSCFLSLFPAWNPDSLSRRQNISARIELIH